ncbi:MULTISPECIES: hypothetical protein [Methylococcus]|uniref:hypothetical protein n=1 Tax=Methylococcus TaxID=413 RepID=UPI001C5282D8|nr:hypothetical protein [Methylococcus capsulatus]QXP89089.1 hypothetical protein KW112_09430 [Methylococcus capsulatus]QXP92294.1 hypothetical protein KW114_07995 [Methylococcus capsulatus]UQN13704.1 hypothetical protein M3M30_11175 [Methylococcus capsulatus]
MIAITTDSKPRIGKNQVGIAVPTSDGKARTVIRFFPSVSLIFLYSQAGHVVSRRRSPLDREPKSLNRRIYKGKNDTPTVA